MALFLYRLGTFSYRRRWLVISLWLAVLVAVGGSAAAFHGTLSNNFQIPGTETQRLADKLKDELVRSIQFPKRMGRPEEFALLVESIARNPYLNGENIRLDGALRFPPK